MDEQNDISSFSIVSVDHYISKPIEGLDPIYSEFRGSEITHVPVIRIFGSNSTGIKACIHVHGVFPYIFIPYEGEETTNIDGYLHQIASSIDKAINISLNQSNASTKHVFNIMLVKGIPFYGFHQKEHQFLKIYFYNPRFVKQVTSLLQNGAIKGKVFQAYDSHIPYILKFFIDFNLYGMSYLHTVTNEIFVRRYDQGGIENEIPFGMKKLNIDCVTVSKIEIDVLAKNILNRLAYQNQDKSDYINPGISSIWADERIRRENIDSSQIPSLEIEIPPDRPNAKIADSEIFYREGLYKNLAQKSVLENSLSSSLDLSSIPNTQLNITKKFDLTSLLNNSVYPAEISENSGKIFNASFIDIPENSQSNSDNDLKYIKLLIDDDDDDDDDNDIVDEEKILSISQRPGLDDTLSPADLALLEVMEMIEAENNETNVDNDSLLAPLTQPQKQLSQTNLNNSQAILEKNYREKEKLDETVKILQSFNNSNEFESDSDDDILNDFSISLIDLTDNKKIDNLKTNETSNEKIFNIIDKEDDDKFWDSFNLSQFDGAEDFGTPEKQKIRTRSKGLSLVQSPLRSLKRTRRKYSELNVNVVTSPSKRKSSANINKIKSHEIKKLSQSSNSNIIVDEPSDDFITNKEKTDEVFESVNQSLNRFRVLLTKCKITNDLDKSPKLNNSSIKPKSPIVKLKKIDLSNDVDKVETRNSIKKKLNKSPTYRSKIYDIENNFFPQPGTSKDSVEKKNNVSLDLSYLSSDEEDKGIQSFYDTTMLDFSIDEKNLESPNNINNSINSDIEPIQPSSFYGTAGSTPNLSKSKISKKLLNSFNKTKDEMNESTPKTKTLKKGMKRSIKKNLKIKSSPCNDKLSIILQKISLNRCLSKEIVLSESNKKEIISIDAEEVDLKKNLIKIYPKINPPDRSLVNDLDVLEYPIEIPQVPFYNNPNDITSGKEVGLSLLKITDKYSGLDDFKSLLDSSENEFTGLLKYRKSLFLTLTDKPNTTNQKIKEFLSNQNMIKISPIEKPPTKIDVLDWLEKEKLIKNSKQLNEDNTKCMKMTIPLRKIRLNSNGDGSDEDESEFELSMTPLTPINENDIIDKTPTPPKSEKSRLRKQKRAKLSLKKRVLPKRLCYNNNDKNSSQMEKLSQKSDNSIGSNSSENTNSSDFIKSLFGNKTNNNKEMSKMLNQSSNEISFLSMNNLNKTYDFCNTRSQPQNNFLTIISVEVFVKTRINLRPDPNIDQVIAIFYNIFNDLPDDDKINSNKKSIEGLLILEDDFTPEEEFNNKISILLKNCGMKVNECNSVRNEKELFLKFIELIQKWDPDIFLGYEIEMSSWGYIIERGYILEINIPQMISRIPQFKVDKIDNIQGEEQGDDAIGYRANFKIVGRIILDVWRLLRHEIALTSYTYENVMYHILHRRTPCHSYQDLTKMWLNNKTRWIVFEYYLNRVKGSLELIEQLDLIGRTCELAKLFGIQFYEVLSRGSQFRVESMMMRMAKPRNFVPVSPNVQQRAHMKAPEYLPLILEPQSRMYLDPVIVLDFQSLYPSMMIAYNYCFSTCLGRVEHLGQNQPFEFGASQLRISPNVVKKLLKDDLITISPCGVVFVKSAVREGVLPRMLKEILDTRLMVKQSMKIHRENSKLQRVLHSRQLGLKLIANVTYGYTAANFSGRMPCVELGDSVVSKGRETLERAIKLVESNDKWKVKVVYGDTDSLFVLVPGRDRKEAFRIGEEISKAVSEQNPQPVKLKLEKVYQPCILQTKKRYVGYMYETPEQIDPIYEAKGIETVRRDGCPAVSKILEKTIRILFETKDVSIIKQYITRQFTKILNDQISIQDLIFAKEFRGINGYKPSACVPALELTRRWMIRDKRAIPRRGERVPFVISNGPPGLPLIRLVRSPDELLNDDGLKINSMYYLNKVLIPPLNRCLLLIGIDVNEWMINLPRKSQTISLLALNCISSSLTNCKKSRIPQYFSTTSCIVNCGNQTRKGICDDCQSKPQITSAILNEKISKIERCHDYISKICQSCCGRMNDNKCISLDCPVLYKLTRTKQEFNQINKFREILNAYFS